MAKNNFLTPNKEFIMKFTFGQIKFYAHQFCRGIPIPIFRNNDINRAINAHINRIDRAKTKKKKRNSYF